MTPTNALLTDGTIRLAAGTGKSMLISHLIESFLREHTYPRHGADVIMVTCVANGAVESIAQRLESLGIRFVARGGEVIRQVPIRFASLDTGSFLGHTMLNRGTETLSTQHVVRSELFVSVFKARTKHTNREYTRFNVLNRELAAEPSHMRTSIISLALLCKQEYVVAFSKTPMFCVCT